MSRIRCAPALLLLLLACDSAAEPEPPRPAAVSVTPTTAELTALGATVRLTAAVRDQNGHPLPSAAVTWTSGTPAVAAVDGSGLVTAVANGTATITATAGAVSTTAMVTVAQVVSTVTVTPAADTVAEADTLRLAALAFDANGHEVAGAGIAWVSADTLVAVVDASGLVTGVAAGSVMIGATASGVTGEAEIEVVPAVPSVVAVSPDTVAFSALGDTAALSAEVFDQVGRPMEGVAVSWASADTAVAVVDSAGVVSAVGAGETVVTATADGAVGVVAVMVDQVAVAVVATPPADTVELGDTLRLSAEAFDRNGHRVAGARFDWRPSDTAVARVDQTGLVTGSGEGTTTITAVAGDASAAAEITVVNPDRAALVALYEATDGPNWHPLETGWLTDAPLGEWYGVTVNDAGRVIRLSLGWIDLENMWLSLNGEIPPEIGDLTALEGLSLHATGLGRLTGGIPPELGKLERLEGLTLRGQFAGRIPSELGDLTKLRTLSLRGDFTGPIPPELEMLTELEWFWLVHESLSGPVPAGFLNLPRLKRFVLEFHCGDGNDPDRIANCAAYDLLCAPSDSMFAWLRDRLAWIRGTEPIRRCGAGSALLTQATQSRADSSSVPLVAGRPAALQVFEVAEADARARFFDATGALVHEMEVGQALLPGSVVRPGLEMVVEGEGWRIPRTGRQSIDVREVPTFSLTLIPFVTRDNIDTETVTSSARDMAADPEGHPLLSYATALLPASDWSVTTHEPVWTDRYGTDAIQRTKAMRLLENGTGYWMGLMSVNPGPGVLGFGYVGGFASVAVEDSHAIAHELGHNLGLLHTPSVGRSVDPEYPYPGYEIGAWGFAVKDVCPRLVSGTDGQGRSIPRCFYEGQQIGAARPDVMSYEPFSWISDYHFTKAMRHRLDREAGTAAAAFAAPKTRTLLLWGGVDSTGTAAHLDPAFLVDAVPSMPDAGGEWSLDGRTEDGREAFRLSFDMPEIADAPGERSAFVFTVPVTWTGELESIRLHGPGDASAVLDRSTDNPMTILRDPVSGQVRAFLRWPMAEAMAAADRADGGRGDLVALFSKGLPR